MEQLRLWRVRRGWSQAALAAHAGVRTTTVQRLEQGIGQPRPGTVGRLCRALACTLDELLTPAELAAVGTRPRSTRSNGAQVRVAAAVPVLCAACAQAVTTTDRRHLAQGGAAHRSCYKGASPRPALADCCLPGGSCGH